MKGILIALYIILGVSINSNAFTFKADSSLGDIYFDKAEELYSKGNYDSSTYYYNKAAEIFKTESRWKNYLISKNYAGINYRFLANLQESFKVLNGALEIGLEKFGTNNSVVADIYNSIGTSYYEKGDYDNAFFNYNKSLQISIRLYGDNHRNTARGYHNVGLIYYWTGDAQKALQHFNKALAIWLPELGEKHSNIGNCYINLANTYYLLADYDKSIEYDLKALEVWKAVLGEDHTYIAMSYNNLADTYETLGKFEESLAYNKKALMLRKKIWGEEHPDVAYSFKNIGSLYTDEEEYDKAQIYFDSAFAIYNNLPDNPGRFEALLSLAGLNKKTGKYEKALSNYDTILTHTLPEALNEDFNIDSINSTYTKIKLWRALSGKGDVYYQKYIVSKNRIDIQNAFYWYQRYSNVLEKIRSDIRNETSKILIGRYAFETNSKLIKTAFELYGLTNQDKYKIKALNYSEKSKSAVLLNAINESGAERFGEIPDSLISQERSLKIDLNYLETQIEEAEEEGTDNTEVLEMEKKLFDINKDYDDLVKNFEEHYPKYYKLKHETRIASLEDIRNFLGKEEELLEYFIGDSSVYIFAIDKENFEMKSVGSTDLTNLVKTLRASLQNIDYESYFSSAEKLYSLLIKPVSNSLKGKKKIYFIPGGILNYLSFEALLTKNVQNKTSVDFSNIPYLINDYEVSYHYSANLLLSSTGNPSIGDKLSFAGFAPVFPDTKSSKKKIETLIDTSIVSAALRSIIINNKKYSSLPESEIEVREISKLFKKSGLPSTTYTYSKANESVLKSKNLNNYNCIHLATHGFINEKHPKLSGLLFSDNEDFEEDGILYSGEIFNLNFNSDLVVLSACESGLGKIVRGEGIIGLTRGFIYSGAKNIVVSLWQVADKSTSELMIEFYKNVLDGKSYSSSLRKAKLKLIKEGTYSYPLEWSPFVLVGH